MLKYDKYSIIKLYILAEIKNKDNNNVNNNLIFEDKNRISFSQPNLIDTLKQIGNIKEDFSSSIFHIKDITDQNYKIYNFGSLKEYIISNSIGIFKQGNFILIDNFKQNKNNEINITNLTMTKVLDECDFFNIIHRYTNNNSDYFKILDIENDDYILVNRLKILFKLQKKKKYELDFGQIIYIGNFKSNKIDDLFNRIEILNDSFIYISNQEIYLNKMLIINNISAIKFFIKDFKNKNQYDIIEIGKIKIELNKKEIITVFTKIKLIY